MHRDGSESQNRKSIPKFRFNDRARHSTHLPLSLPAPKPSTASPAHRHTKRPRIAFPKLSPQPCPAWKHSMLPFAEPITSTEAFHASAVVDAPLSPDE